jgi:hypothetical protein
MKEEVFKGQNSIEPRHSLQPEHWRKTDATAEMLEFF